jgi:hypothetical protein
MQVINPASGRPVAELDEAGLDPEYLELRSTRDLSPVERVNGSTLLAVAARVGAGRATAPEDGFDAPTARAATTVTNTVARTMSALANDFPDQRIATSLV